MSTTRATLLKELVQELFPEQYIEFTALAASTTTLVQANELHHEDASENGLDPGWLYIVDGAAAGDARGITAYEPRASVTYGTVVPHRPMSADVDGTSEGFVYSGGLDPTQLLRHINTSLRRSRRERLIPLGSFPDGLMEESGTSGWIATNATLTKTATADEGEQGLLISNTSANGKAQPSSNLYCRAGEQFNVEASVFVSNQTGDAHTATLQVRDVNHDTIITSVSTQSRARVWLRADAIIPAGCHVLSLNLVGSEADTTVIWDQVLAWKPSTRNFRLPTTVTKFDQVLDVYQRVPISKSADGTGDLSAAYDLQRLPNWVLRADPTAASPYVLDVSRSGWNTNRPLVVECLLPWPEMASDTEETDADKDDVLLRAKALAYAQLARLSPREDRRFYQDQADRLATTWSRAASRQPRPPQPVKGPRSSGRSEFRRYWWRGR
jgi:hypothetical protein